MKSGRMFFWGLTTLVLLALTTANAAQDKRAIILGFDGIEPTIASAMMDKGELPNLAKLRESGQFEPLQSSNPPQSPTAWSDFATCRAPLNHGIYDFLRRDPKTYIPSPGFGSVKQPSFTPDGILQKAPQFVNYRQGDTFWKVGSAQGLRVKALGIPFAYPADALPEGSSELCGLDVRDIRGTQSTYFAFSEDFSAKEEDVAGGVHLQLAFTGNTATAEVPGLRSPKDRQLVRVPMSFEVDRAAKTVKISVQGQSAALKEGAWSPWLEWSFAVTPQYTVRAISRFHCMEAGTKVRIYMTCLQYHPREPMIPFSAPPAYSGELADRYGLFKTIGWTCDTKALEKDDMTEDMFLEDARQTMAWYEHLTLDEIDRGNFDLLAAGWTEPDRVSHMFWRFRDPKHPLYTEEGAKKYGRVVEDTYITMDRIVGEVTQRLKPGDLLMILSDHGFHSFHTGFSVNTWLIRNGYLVVKGQPDQATAVNDNKYLVDFKSGDSYYDWSKSKAYGLGLGMIFLNLQGREGQGIVAPAEAPALLANLRTQLLAVTEPKSGEKIFEEIATNVNPQGAATLEAPDIQLGYADGYQTDKNSAAGAAPKDLFSPNDSKWSGEHASSGQAITPGIFFSNRKLRTKPGLRDLGVTALDYLGAKPDAAFEGATLLEKQTPATTK